MNKRLAILIGGMLLAHSQTLLFAQLPIPFMEHRGEYLPLPDADVLKAQRVQTIRYYKISKADYEELRGEPSNPKWVFKIDPNALDPWRTLSVDVDSEGRWTRLEYDSTRSWHMRAFLADGRVDYEALRGATRNDVYHPADTLRHYYDANGRLDSVIGQTFTMQFSAELLRVKENYWYDAKGQLREKESKRWGTYGRADPVVRSSQYNRFHYDSQGRMRARTVDVKDEWQHRQIDYAYAYDSLGRMHNCQYESAAGRTELILTYDAESRVRKLEKKLFTVNNDKDEWRVYYNADDGLPDVCWSLVGDAVFRIEIEYEFYSD